MAATGVLGVVRISLWRQLECWEWSGYRYGGNWSAGSGQNIATAAHIAGQDFATHAVGGQNIATRKSERSEYR